MAKQVDRRYVLNETRWAGGTAFTCAVVCDPFRCDLVAGIGNRVNDTAVGSLVYTYDAFGRTVSQSGPLADVFRHRFSTKYHDAETHLYYYGYRFYAPALMRWLNRDPIGEQGGANLYGFCGNNPLGNYDFKGYAYFAVRKLSGFPFDLNSKMVHYLNGRFTDKHNIQILHEHLFFQDGKFPQSIGYTGSGTFYEEFSSSYIKVSGGYNDCVMRIATTRVSTPMYSLIGNLFNGFRDKFNCQDYAEELRKEYAKLLQDPKVRCKCFGKLK